jgi:hypothetical protein
MKYRTNQEWSCDGKFCLVALSEMILWVINLKYLLRIKGKVALFDLKCY